MNIKQLDAVSAYTQATKQMQEGLESRNGKDGVSGEGSVFSSMVTDAIGNVEKATTNLEVQSAKALVGDANMVDVVTAASNAEMVVNTVVSVRDKGIAAYNDILKMPV
ncbi:MAG: flagellar hook-basal body complex protein FliE [Kordiimonas sp.]